MPLSRAFTTCAASPPAPSSCWLRSPPALAASNPPYLTRLRELLDEPPTLAVGSLLRAFPPRPNGQFAALSNLRGRYVPLDF